MENNKRKELEQQVLKARAHVSLINAIIGVELTMPTGSKELADFSEAAEKLLNLSRNWQFHI